MGLVALLVHSAAGSDVFSDAATFRRGFIDANGNGLFTVGKAEFPDALKAGDADNAVHHAGIKGCSTGVVLRTETVCYPYANVCREETVAYFPQTVFKKEGQEKDYLISSVVNLTDASPFAVTNANQYTYFLRYRWDGTRTTNSYAGVFLNAGWVYGKSYVEGDPMTGGAGSFLASMGRETSGSTRDTAGATPPSPARQAVTRYSRTNGRTVQLSCPTLN